MAKLRLILTTLLKLLGTAYEKVFGMVLQDTWLFDSSIREKFNVRES